ncbi:MAG: hypothetical protein HY619_00375 [Thaumarchaeota archaeon]|nr:hypothetical protein [Nitrososphaerota archaeon]
MQAESTHLLSGLKRFYSIDQIRSYINGLSEFYENEASRYGDWLGDLLRKAPPVETEAPEKEKKPKLPKGKSKVPKGAPKPTSKGWIKIGSIQVNTNEPTTGSAEVLFEVLEEFKLKHSKAKEALQSLDNLTNISIPENASYLLYVKEGLVERLIVDVQKTKPTKFDFTANFAVIQKAAETSA